MQKISFYYRGMDFSLKKLLTSKISNYNKLKIILESIHGIIINSRNESLEIKKYLDLKFELLMSIYYIYHDYNRNCAIILELISDIKNAISNPSRELLEKLFSTYSEFDKKIIVTRRYKNNINDEKLKAAELKVEQFKNCIFYIIYSIEYCHKYKNIPDFNILEKFIDGITKANSEDGNLKNQIRICYKFLENNFKERI